MNWIEFTKLELESISRGAVFCFPAKHPFESKVHFMLIEEPESDSGFKFICSSGYHSGQTEVFLPQEATATSGGIDKKWLIDNWTKWVYPETPIEMVQFIEHYSAE